MATNLKDLIDSLNGNDIPTNIFTIEDEDPNVILGKLNEVIAYLERLQSTINASDKKANEALQKANEALTQCIEAVKFAEEAFKTAETAEEKAQQAINATKVLENLVPRVEEALSQLDETNKNMAVVEELANNAITTATTANTNAVNAVNSSNEAVEKANQALIDNTTQDGIILSLESKNTAQDNLISTLANDIKKESETRANEDSDIRDTINRIVAGESELNEEILNQIKDLDTNKADKTSTNTHLDNLDTEISNIKVKDTQQDTRLTAVESKNTAQDLEISNIKTKDTQQDSRLTAVENKATANANEIDGIHTLTDTMLDDIMANTNSIKTINTKNTSQDTEISNIKTKDTQQDNRLTAVENKNTAQDTSITNLSNRIKANEEDIINMTDMLAGVEEDVSTNLPNKDVKEIGLTIEDTTNPNISQNRKLSIVPIIKFNDDTTIKGNNSNSSIAFSTAYFKNRGGNLNPFIDISDSLYDLIHTSILNGTNNYTEIKDPNSTNSIQIFVANVVPSGSSNKITFPTPFNKVPYITGISTNNNSSTTGTFLEVENVTTTDVTFHGIYVTKSSIGKTGGDIRFTLIAISLNNN